MIGHGTLLQTLTPTRFFHEIRIMTVMTSKKFEVKRNEPWHRTLPCVAELAASMPSLTDSSIGSFLVSSLLPHSLNSPRRHHFSLLVVLRPLCGCSRCSPRLLLFGTVQLVFHPYCWLHSRWYRSCCDVPAVPAVLPSDRYALPPRCSTFALVSCCPIE